MRKIEERNKYNVSGMQWMKYNRRLLVWGVAIIFVAVCILGVHIYAMVFYNNPRIKVSFLDVGQGDAILISSGNTQVLIDGGKDPKILLDRLGEQMPYGDTSIEMVIATHPDADHIGGFSEIIPHYTIASVGETTVRKDSSVYQLWEKNIYDYNLPRYIFSFGEKIVFSNGASIRVLYPFRNQKEDKKDTNSMSLVLLLEYKEQSFLLTGDIPADKESLIETHDADVLKVSHHGSKTSTSQTFLEAMKPEDAIISVGKENSYGHPHQEVIQALRDRGVRMFRTDESGSITYICGEIEDYCFVEKRK